MTYEKTGRDRGDGATRKSLLQQIHADFPGNGTEAQRANQSGAVLFDALVYRALCAWAAAVALWLVEVLG